MRYSISHWTGRLGNNIQQVANALLFAQKTGTSFEQILDHDIINKFYVNFGSDGERISGRFYSWEPLVNCETGIAYGQNETGNAKEYIYENIRNICKNYVYDNLKKIDYISDDTLVIHIRSGDIFDVEYKIPHNYVQNPLAYYLTLIENFDDVLVVAEPGNNPIVDKLKNIKKIRFQSKSLIEDYSTLIAARNLSSSGVGTFAISAALCSRNIKNFYTSNLHLSEHLNYKMLYNTDVTVHELDLPNYIPTYPCSWKNDSAQRDLLLNYKLP